MIHDFCVLMLTAGVTSLLFKLFKQPVVLGYIVAGMLVGPHVLGESWVSNEESVETWGEIGVLFLLFSLGLEFSFKKLIQVGSTALISAGVIVAGMMCVGFAAGLLMKWDMMNSLFLGGMLCMSSTTIVFKAIEEAGLRSHRFAKVCFGILIVEDLFAVILMVLLSSIAVKNSFEGKELLFQILKLILYLASWFIVGILAIPTFLKVFKKHLNNETLSILSIGMCLGMVLLALDAGFSSALGAFVMGSVLAETLEAERIEHLVQPMKNVFGAIFFVSVGMMIDPSLLLQYWVQITIISLIVIFGQIIFATIGTLLSGQPLRVSLQTGFSLVQIGEFAFIIATLGQSLGVTDLSLYPIVVAVSVVTTFLTPYIMPLAYPTLAFFEKHMSENTRHLLETYSNARTATNTSGKNPFIFNIGQRILLLLSFLPGVKQILNLFFSNLYAREKKKEEQQALQKDTESLLLSLDIHISEFTVPSDSRFCGKALKDIDIRKLSGANIVGIVRSGININIPGGEHRIFPEDRIVVAGNDEQMAKFQEMLDGSIGHLPEQHSKIILQNIAISNSSPLCGKTIRETDIRKKNSCIIMGIIKPDEDILMNPDPKTRIEEGDFVILAGEKQKIEALSRM